MGFEGFPLIIGWELTLLCNLRCNHCGSTAGNPRKGELSLEESLAICDQFPDLLVQEVNFTGGEPLLHPHWVKIAAHLHKLKINTKILTNGLTLDSNTISKIKEVGISGVGVSLDGLEQTHDYIRGKDGVFHTLLSGIERVQNAGIDLTVITTINNLNYNELPMMLELLKSLGIKQWQIQPIFTLGRVRNKTELQLTDQAYLQLGAFVYNWEMSKDKSALEILPGDSFGYFTEFDKREPPWRGCPAGQVSCGITSDGKVKGCLSLPDEIVEGDLRKEDLWTIWFHPNSFLYTRQYSSNELGKYCQSCDKAEQCRGGCSAMSYGSTGYFHNDYYCFYRINNHKLFTS